jgi:hypothetical protein
MHLPSECHLGNQHKEEQLPTVGGNSATYATAAVSIANPQFQAIIASMTGLLGWFNEDWWCTPARTWNLLACVAGSPLLDIGQFNVIMYHFIFILPIIIISLMHSFFPKNPKSLRFLKPTILRGTPWAFRGHRGPICRRRRKVKTKVKNQNPETTATTRHWLRHHLPKLQAEASTHTILHRNIKHNYSSVNMFAAGQSLRKN